MIFSLLQDSFRSPYRGNERNEKKSGLGNRRNETNRENEKLNNSRTIYAKEQTGFMGSCAYFKKHYASHLDY